MFKDKDGDLSIAKITMTVVGTIVFIILLLFINPFSIIGGSQRGIRYLFGKPSESILGPGLQTHAPLVGSIKKFSMVPTKMSIDINFDGYGAITKDNQIIGTRIVIYYRYDESRLYEVATKFSSKDSIENPLASVVNSSIKSIIGKYTIFELAENQDKIGSELLSKLTDGVKQYPIQITQLNISNFDWSPEFDKRINETMAAAQEVKRAEQQANIAEQENKRLVIEQKAKADAMIAEAQGKLKAAELQAEAAKVKAQGEKDAKILEGEGIQKYNQLIAQNLQVEIRLKELEIELEKAKRWDGRQVPTYVPLSPNGGIVSLPSK